MNIATLRKLEPINREKAWVLWRYVDIGRPKPAKMPYSITGTPAAVDNPETWATLPDILQAPGPRHFYDGIGYVFHGTGLVGVDLDHCIDNGRLQPWAAAIVQDLATYAEISPSGAGVHILAIGAIPQGKRAGQVEIYATRRYFAMTGDHLAGTPDIIKDRGAAILRLYASLMPERADVPTVRATAAVSSDDYTLLERARAARNGAKFAALWQGDNTAHGGDVSAADLALCSMLAYWAGNDAARVDRLFRQSGRYRRKWDRPHYSDGTTYGQHTIAVAIGKAANHG